MVPSGPTFSTRYEFSQSIAPGQLITNLYRNPDLSVNGPYALCGKCHNLTNVVANNSFTQHAAHINSGFTCSTCHTAHGMGGVNPNISGQRLVNFDVNVVAQNGAFPVSYNKATKTCVLACHETAHNPNGSVSSARVLQADQKNSVLSHRGGTRKEFTCSDGLSPVQLYRDFMAATFSSTPPRKTLASPARQTSRPPANRPPRNIPKSLRCPA